MGRVKPRPSAAREGWKAGGRLGSSGSCGGPSPSPAPEQVEPYFKGADGAEAPFRPVTEGDVIQLQLGAQLAEFKVVETEPPRHCIVSPETAIDMEEEPLERSVEEVLLRPPPARTPAPAPRPIATACRRLPPPAAACGRLPPPDNPAGEDT